MGSPCLWGVCAFMSAVPGVCASMSAVPGTGLGANKMARWSARCHYIPQDEFGRRKLCAAGRRS